MILTINGEKCQLADGTVLTAYLEERSYRPDRIAVELNRNIVPKKLYGETVLNDGDELEVVTFMGGG